MGREITVGSTVVYPVRRGAKMWMQQIKVNQVVPGPTDPETKLPTATLGGFNREGRKITLHNVSNVTVVEPVIPTV